MTDRPIRLLQQLPVFGGLPSRWLEFLLDRSSTSEVSAGDYFFREADPGNALFVLESGEVLVEKLWEGRPVFLGNLGEGECFGEMSLVDLQPRSASVRAVQDSRAIKIDREALAELYQQDLEPYAIIMMNMGREISRRLRRADERLFQLEQSQTDRDDLDDFDDLDDRELFA